MTLRLNGATSGFVEIKAADEANDNSLVLPDGGDLVAATDGNIDVTSINDLNYPTSGPLSNRNLIINGAMQVAQRGTSISLAQSGAYTLDKFEYHTTAIDTYSCTVARSSTAPAGFTSSLQLTTGTAETLAANEFVYISQKIEAQNLQHLQFGTAAAQSVTLSFWVRSSQTGTFGINLYQSDGNDLINSTYTISTADTWERKTFTFPGNTTASPANDNGEGFRISWILAAGTDWTGTSQTTWGSYSDAAWAGDHAQNGVVTTASATWYLTGVQLEVGTVATPFEHRSYSDELARCQRYYQVLVDGSIGSTVGNAAYYTASNVRCNISFRTEMRNNPNVEVAASGTDTYNIFRGGLADACSPPAGSTSSPFGCELSFGTGVSGTAGQAGFIRTSDSDCKIAVEADL